MKITGTIYKLIETEGTSAAGKNWKKTELILKSGSDTYAFATWGEVTKMVKELRLGQQVEVEFSIECREYNGKYYTNLSAKSVEVIAQPEEYPQNNTTQVIDDLPF